MPASLLFTVNCSISNETKHLKTKDLHHLFLNLKNKKNLKPIEKYAIRIIQTEAHPQEIEWFQKEFNIPQKNIDYVLQYHA